MTTTRPLTRTNTSLNSTTKPNASQTLDTLPSTFFTNAASLAKVSISDTEIRLALDFFAEIGYHFEFETRLGRVESENEGEERDGDNAKRVSIETGNNQVNGYANRPSSSSQQQQVQRSASVSANANTNMIPSPSRPTTSKNEHVKWNLDNLATTTEFKRTSQGNTSQDLSQSPSRVNSARPGTTESLLKADSTTLPKRSRTLSASLHTSTSKTGVNRQKVTQEKIIRRLLQMFPHMSSKDLQELFGMHNTSSGARDDIGYEDLRKLLCGGAGKRALIPSLGEIFKIMKEPKSNSKPTTASTTRPGTSKRPPTGRSGLSTSESDQQPHLTTKDLHYLIQTFLNKDGHIHKNDVKVLLQHFDKDGDGVIGFDDFRKMHQEYTYTPPVYHVGARFRRNGSMGPTSASGGMNTMRTSRSGSIMDSVNSSMDKRLSQRLSTNMKGLEGIVKMDELAEAEMEREALAELSKKIFEDI